MIPRVDIRPADIRYQNATILSCNRHRMQASTFAAIPFSRVRTQPASFITTNLDYHLSSCTNPNVFLPWQAMRRHHGIQRLANHKTRH